MQRMTGYVDLSDEMKQITIPELIERAKLFIIGRKYSQNTIWHYNERFNDLLHLSSLYGTEKLSEGFITHYINEGMQRCIWLASSSVKRKSLLNLIASATNAANVFINDSVATKIQNRCLRENLSAYGMHLKSQDKSRGTVISYMQTAANFLLYLEEIKKYDLAKVTAIDIRGFITELGKKWSPRSMQIVPSHLKRYLNFANFPADIVIFSNFRTSRKSRSVHAMNAENVESLWKYVESGGGDLRSKAILAIMLSTGMRPSDTVKLQIGDINWNSDSISFVQNKTGEGMGIRLFPVIGSSIIRYITEQRPKDTGAKSIFLTKNAPFREISATNCNHIIKAAFKKTGIEFIPDGLHCPRAVRRSLVSRMIDKGVPVQKAAASIGHVDEKSIDLYTELDMEKMRAVCLPIPMAMRGWRALNG